MKELTRPKTMLIIVLAIIMTMIAPLKAAAAPKNQYVGDLYLAYGSDAESAKQALIDKGFTPIEGNLNDGGKTYAMLGYTTTDDIRYAVTDVAVMNMRGDYSVEDYKNMLKEKKGEIVEFLEEFMTVIKEYRANYEAKKTRAVYIHDLLNQYTEDDSGKKMGDLLIEDTLQDEVGIQKSITAKNEKNLPDLVTILLQGNSEVIKSMELLLSMATDPSDDTWIDRFSKMSLDDLLASVAKNQPKLNTEAKRLQYLDNTYGGIAQIIAVDIAATREKLIAYEASGLKIETATEEDIKKVFGDTESSDEEKAAESAVAIQNWMAAGSLYENLKSYEGGNFKKGELLDFFMDEESKDDIERLYPIAASLSEGQVYGLPFVSFESLLKNAFADDKDWQSQAKAAKATIDGLNEISVYANIDRGIYQDDGTVALTDKAIRERNIANGTKGSQKDKMDALSIVTSITWAALAISSFVTYVAAVKTVPMYHEAQSLAKLICDPNVSSETKEMLDLRMSDIDLDDLKWWRDFTKYAAFATIAIGLISATFTAIDLLRDTSVEQLPIPKYLVDSRTDAEGNSFSVNYKAVECNREEYFGSGYSRQTGSSADLMADEGKQWLTLYVSRNSLAGNPILADFLVQQNTEAPKGLSGNVHIVGEKGAVNIASGSFRNYSTFTKTINLISDKKLYMFYGISDTPKTYDESAGNMTASVFNSGTSALFGFGGIAIGAVLGAALAVMLRKKKETKVA